MWSFQRFANVCEAGEPSPSPEFSAPVPAFVSLHLPHVVPADPGGTCLLFVGAWDGFSPFANVAKTAVCVTALLPDTTAETQNWGLVSFWFLPAPIPPCVL